MDAGEKVGIIDSCKNRLWNLLMELKLIRLTKEKGIDILLAADAIELAYNKKVEWICVLTGDADYVPAIKLIKKLEIKTLNLHAYAGSSTELRLACDMHALIGFDDERNPKIQW